MKYTDQQKSKARELYFANYEVTDIAKELNVNLRTLYNWIESGNWQEVANRDNTLYVLERRIWQLTFKENKNVMDLFELDKLVCNLEKLKLLDLRIKRQEQKNTPADGEAPPKKKRGRKAGKNDFTEVTADQVEAYLKEGLFEYQLELWGQRNQRNRNILKSRQIGATFYFAKEAFCDALLTGKNKIFISASRAQAEVFKEYIKHFALDGFQVELIGGQKIELHTPHGVATLYFLSTNSSTAQSYHGDLYVDEYFWIPRFSKLKTVASAMATHAKWTKTYFSTPSSTDHEAYKFWTGDEFNDRNRKRNKAVELFPDHEHLRKQGTLCPDNQWRKVITLDDAEAGGCNLFNRKELQLEYSEDEFNQLFMCQFIDTTGSVFSYKQLQACISDRSKFPPNAHLLPCYLGYDPSRTTDGSCIVIMTAPQSYKGKMYILEKITLKNMPWPEQANYIKELLRKYNIIGMTIDCTGIGNGVFEYIRLEYPQAIGLHYSPDIKTKLVLKAQQVINDKRLAWDAVYSDIAAGFLQIKRTTSRDANIKYYADRTAKRGHADAAWAVMHALSHEEFILPDTERPSQYEFFS